MNCEFSASNTQKKQNILVFAGTTEGREFAVKAVARGFTVTVSVATEYGTETLKENLSPEVFCRIKLIEGRLDEKQMETVFLDFDAVIDATHPYAVQVTSNIEAACKKTDRPYFRLLRCQNIEESSDNQEFIRYFDSLEEICQELSKKKFENSVIFNSCGSKELLCFSKIPDYKERIFLRVLPSIDSIQKCIQAGFPQSHIIAMQGPFSQRINEAMFYETKAQILITKESGKNGGYDEKIQAAKNCGMKVFCVRRPKENKKNIYKEPELIFQELYRQDV